MTNNWQFSELTVKHLLIQRLESAIAQASVPENSLKLTKDACRHQIPLNRAKNSTRVLYVSAIALKLAKFWQQPPQAIATQLAENLKALCSGDFAIEVAPSGIIQFELTDVALAVWLQRLAQTPLPLPESRILSAVLATDRLFPIQYSHARCCSLLRMANRDRIIAIVEFDRARACFQTFQSDSDPPKSPLKRGTLSEFSPFKMGTLSEFSPFKMGTLSEFSPFKMGTLSEFSPFKMGTLSELPPFKMGTLTQFSPFKMGTLTQFSPFKMGTLSEFSPLFKGGRGGSPDLKTRTTTPQIWSLIAPNPIPWLDEDGRLRLVHPAEYNLISQLLAVLDSLAPVIEQYNDEKPVNHFKLANSLSEAFQTFYSLCRIWGEVKIETPKLAQARLGLVLATQSLLRFILEELLNVVAPLEL
jgi:Arginyl tRNA synthetase N terminal domain/DALR anticodon binding domain